MTIQDKLKASATQLMASGERVEFAIPGRSRNPGWRYLERVPFIGFIASFVLFVLDLIRNPRLVVVVTLRRILLCHRRRYRNRVGKTIRELPRSIQIGHVDGPRWFKTESLGQNVYIYQRFIDDVMRADVAARRADAN